MFLVLLARSGLQKHPGDKAFFYLSGKGHTLVDGVRYDWGEEDLLILPIRPDGSLGEPSAFVQHTGSSVNPSRQKEPHAHSINPSPDNRFAIAADLGLDKLLVYRLDAAKGTLTPNDPAAAQVSQAVERYYAQEGRYPEKLQQLIPWYLLSVPEPVLINGLDWCYDGGADYFRLGYADREHWSAPNWFLFGSHFWLRTALSMYWKLGIRLKSSFWM